LNETAADPLFCAYCLRTGAILIQVVFFQAVPGTHSPRAVAHNLRETNFENPVVA
jgi:hypothetical protein